MKSFFSCYQGVFIHPFETFRRLADDSRKLAFGFYAVLITAVLYTLVYVFLIFGGGQPYKPWLDIAPEEYYRYNVYFCAPSMLLGWILAAAVTHTLMRIYTQTGSFEQTLGLFGFGISVASWATGIHDLVTSFLGATQVIDQRAFETALNSPTIWRTILWGLMILYLLWFVALFTKAVQVVYQWSAGKAVGIGFIAFVVYQMFFFIFNR